MRPLVPEWRAKSDPFHAVAVSRILLLGTVIILVVIAYFPFHWDPPRMVRNDVTRVANGSLRFGEMNDARTPGTPGWLHAVQTSGRAEISVAFRPQSPLETAAIMMLASDFWHTDFAIGQDHADLLVWLRRPGSDGNGDPPFTLHGVIQPQRWNNVQVILQRTAIRIDVDGTPRLSQHLAAGYAEDWNGGQIALGGEVHGGGHSWQGEIGLAAVTTSHGTVDYVQPGALSIPAHYFYAPNHVEPFPPAGTGQWLIVFLDMLSFVPAGFFLVRARRSLMRPDVAALLAAALAVLLAAGKFLFYARHTAVAIVVMQAVGGLLGALLAARFGRRAQQRAVLPARTGPFRCRSGQ